MLAPALVALLSAPVHAADVLMWSYDDYPSEAYLDGVDGWAAGWDEDPWYGYVSSSSGRHYAMPLTDDNGGGFGSGEAADNWLVNEETRMLDGWILSSVYTEDNDCVGLVFELQDARNFYALLMTDDGTPVAGHEGTILVRVREGAVEVLDSSESSFYGYTLQNWSISFNDGQVRARVWEGFDTGGSPYIELSGEDPSPPRTSGRGGFYSYDAGYDGGGGSTEVYFGPVEAYAYDDDGDGVIDDEDNCEDVVNADQADGDDDGIGTACDGDEGDGGAGDGGAGDGGAGDGGAGDGGFGDGGGSGDGGFGDGGGSGDGGTGDGGTGDGGSGDAGLGDGGSSDSGTADGGSSDGIDGLDADLTSCGGCNGAAGFVPGLGALGLAGLAGLRRRRGDGLGPRR